MLADVEHGVEGLGETTVGAEDEGGPAGDEAEVLLEAEGAVEVALLVAEEGKRQAVVGGKAGLESGRILAHADDGCAGCSEGRSLVAEPLGLERAAGRVGARIEEDDE